MKSARLSGYRCCSVVHPDEIKCETHELKMFVSSVGAYVGLMYDRVRASISVCCSVLQCYAVSPTKSGGLF